YEPVGGAAFVPGVWYQDGAVQENNHPSVLYRTPNGHLWISVIRDGNLFVQRSVDGGATWLAAPVSIDASIVPDGGVVAFGHATNDGATSLVLVASENDAGRILVYRIDQDAPSIDAAMWTSESSALPGWVGSERSDDHISVRSFEDRVYVAYKSED